MGQYYLIANMDKKEVLLVNGRCTGRKLLEIAMFAGEYNAIISHLATEWKGDNILLVGDYASLDDTKEPYFNAYRKWTDKFHVESSLYNFIEENFTKVEANTDNKPYRYIYNHEKKCYIDLAHCRKCGRCNKIIVPLFLLIAMGNGYGGGDYYGSSGCEYVGTWCDSSDAVEITEEPMDKLGYEEFHPDFYEGD